MYRGIYRLCNSVAGLWIVVWLSGASAVSAHEYAELNQTLPNELQTELLSIFHEVAAIVPEAAAPDDVSKLALAERVAVRHRLYEEAGRLEILRLIAESPLREAFEPAPYTSYMEMLSGLLYDYEQSRNDSHFTDEHLDDSVRTALEALFEELAQWAS